MVISAGAPIEAGYMRLTSDNKCSLSFSSVGHAFSKSAAVAVCQSYFTPCVFFLSIRCVMPVGKLLDSA